MIKLLIALLLATVSFAKAQNNVSILVMDFITVANGNFEEASHFYHNNWMVFRKAALSENYIKSYELIVADPHEKLAFDLTLVTEYANIDQLHKSEENFQKVMKGIRPEGPSLLNEKKPNDFKINSYSIKSEIESKSNIEAVKLEIQQILRATESFSTFYMNANYDGLANSYTEDAKILPPNTKIIEGREAIRNKWILPDGMSILMHKVTPSEITIRNEYAYDIGLYEGISRTKAGVEIPWKGKYLIVWKKEKGEWKIYADAWNRIN
jgi:ketosteroid isomerase-like protein